MRKIIFEVDTKIDNAPSHWKLDFIKVIYNKNIYSFELPNGGNWQVTEYGAIKMDLEPSSSQSSMSKYMIDVKTANEVGAGTDANVKIEIDGDEEETFELNKVNSITKLFLLE